MASKATVSVNLGGYVDASFEQMKDKFLSFTNVYKNAMKQQEMMQFRIEDVTNRWKEANDKLISGIKDRNIELVNPAVKEQIKENAVLNYQTEIGNAALERQQQIYKIAINNITDKNAVTLDTTQIMAALTPQTLKQAEAELVLQERTSAYSRAAKIKRAELMNTSISFFVLGISMNQAISGLARMAGTNTVLGKSLYELTGFLQTIIGPLQIFTAIQTIVTNNNWKMLASFGALLMVVGAIYFIYKMMTAKTLEQKIMYAALLGVVIGLGAGFWYLAYASSAAASAMTLGTAAVPIIAGIVALTGALIAFSMKLPKIPKAFTTDFQTRMMTQDGLIYAHRGERIGKVSTPMSRKEKGGVTVNNHFYGVGVMDDTVKDRMTKEIDFSVRRALESA